MQAFNFSGISVRDIEFWRGERRVLAALSLDLPTGECLHVLGPNGSGKTTLLRVIAGLLFPEQGRIECNGRETRTDRDSWHASFCYLGHSDALKAELTAAENLAYETGLRRDVGASEIAQTLADLGLKAIDGLPIAALSAGQRRRISFARVVLARAPLWILDEPYTNLDRDGVVLVSALIGRHLDAGGAALVAAHQPPAIPGHRPRSLELAA